MNDSYETPTFDDLDELDRLLTDARASDHRTVSSIEQARQIIGYFRNGDIEGPWNGLERTQVAGRLLEILENPRTLRQGNLNLCGPASFVVMWASRDPLGFAVFSTELYENGAAHIGSRPIVPSDALLAQDYTAIAGRADTHGADWMILSAIRNTSQPFWQSSWVGNPEQQLAALTRPEELADWLGTAGIYKRVRNEGNWVTPAGIPHATSIEFHEGRDVALLIHSNLLNAAKGTPIERDLLLHLFPNHYVVALNNITVAVMDGPAGDNGLPIFRKGDVLLSIWSWGENSLDLAVPQQAFVDNYYGAVIADLA